MEPEANPIKPSLVTPAAQAPPARFVGWVLLPAVLAIAWLVSRAQWFWSHRPDLQFGWMVLLLCGFLLWEAWERRPALRLEWSGWSLGLAAAGLGLLLVVQVYMAAFGMMAAALAGLYVGVMLIVGANLHYAFGVAGWRRFGFAFAFLGIALPMPGMIQAPVVSGLQWMIASLNVEILNLIGVPARQVGSLIQLSNGTVGIDEACSGIRSLQSTVMATLFIGQMVLRRPVTKVFLLVGGIGLAVLGNLVRSLGLSLVANAQGLGAIARFHDTAGWSVLAFTVVGVILAAWLLNRLEKKSRDA